MSSHKRKNPKKKTALRRRLRAATKKEKPPAAFVRSAGDWFEKLVALQARLRAPGGCSWDREQTHLSLRTFLLEETYEALEALDDRDDRKLVEELGDLLLQIVFHAEIAREKKRFEIADAIREIHDKLVRRHPHVFGKTRARNAAEVLQNWEHLKAAERRAKQAAAGAPPGVALGASAETSLLDGVPRSLPATLEGLQLTRRAARIGFDWDDVEGILAKLREETAELRHSVQSKNAVNIEEEIGDLLFAAVNLARFLETDPEVALKKANRKFAARFRTMERTARKSGRALADVPREEMEQLWESAKREESEPHPVKVDRGPWR